MCNPAGVTFVTAQFETLGISESRVLEVGSYDVNGGVREIAERFSPSEYIGVDIAEGPGVDQVCAADSLVDRFGAESFDWVISTEMLEHVPDWKSAVTQMKAALRPGGRLILTTRSPGFGLHGYPADFWRFTVEDMRVIFADFDDLVVEADSPEPGVFVTGVRSTRKPIPLEPLSIYSVVTRTKRSRATVPDQWASRVLVAGKFGSLRLARRVIPGSARAALRKLVR